MSKHRAMTSVLELGLDVPPGGTASVPGPSLSLGPAGHIMDPRAQM